MQHEINKAQVDVNKNLLDLIKDLDKRLTILEARFK
jgi:hypothetical protein